MRTISLNSTKFKGHRIRLVGTHPQAGQIGIFIGTKQKLEEPHQPYFCVLKLEETGEEVFVEEEAHWQLA